MTGKQPSAKNGSDKAEAVLSPLGAAIVFLAGALSGIVAIVLALDGGDSAPSKLFLLIPFGVMVFLYKLLGNFEWATQRKAAPIESESAESADPPSAKDSPESFWADQGVASKNPRARSFIWGMVIVPCGALLALVLAVAMIGLYLGPSKTAKQASAAAKARKAPESVARRRAAARASSSPKPSVRPEQHPEGQDSLPVEQQRGGEGQSRE
jgi:hypothetical protein